MFDQQRVQLLQERLAEKSRLQYTSTIEFISIEELFTSVRESFYATYFSSSVILTFTGQIDNNVAVKDISTEYFQEEMLGGGGGQDKTTCSRVEPLCIHDKTTCGRVDPLYVYTC